MKVYTAERGRKRYYDVPVEPTGRHPFLEEVVNFSKLYETGLLDQFYKRGLKFPEWLDGCCSVRPVVRDKEFQTPRVGDNLIIHGPDANYNLGKIIEIWEFGAENSHLCSMMAYSLTRST